MAKLTFKWTLRGEEATPSIADVENLRNESFIFQLDFLNDVIFEAKKLYNETLDMAEARDNLIRLERINGSSTAH